MLLLYVCDICTIFLKERENEVYLFFLKKGYLEKYILSLIDLEKDPQPHSLEKQPQHLGKIDTNSLYNMIVHVHVHAQLVGK